MKYFCILLISFYAFLACTPEVGKHEKFTTVCNPIDLSYRFRPEEPSRREAADPTVIQFDNKYWLFASKSGGYWYSDDLKSWEFVLSMDIPTEDYAPTAIAINDTIYMAVSSQKNKKVYKTADPMSGKWIVEDSLDFPVEDPAFFMDDDERLYLYWGCSNKNPLYAAELDLHTFSLKSEIHEVIYQDPDSYGWEVRGDSNTELDNPPWLEGLWMTKYSGKYYLQYAAPGTLEKSYSDGVYISDYPLGPFELAINNPFSMKPSGFACGAGHGSTIRDEYGNYWHFGTITISRKDKFERRIGFYPTFFDEDDILYTNTKYGDYPTIVPIGKIESHDDLFPGWMLLSYNKKVTTSSAMEGFPAENMTDEEIRTYWAAQSGDQGEWASIDLGEEYDVYALQINFYEHQTALFGRTTNKFHRYTIEASGDEENWNVILDKSENNTDNSHDYTQLSEVVKCRYLRLINVAVPDGNLALCGFRVFGIGDGPKPSKVEDFSVSRKTDRRGVHLEWTKSSNVQGYNISYGSSKDKLYHNYLVYDKTSIDINSLNVNQEYYFSIEAFNENGISKKSVVYNAD